MMAGISKTAKAAMKAATKMPQKPKEEISTERTISIIRSDRAGRLQVMNMELVDKLLAEHDRLVKAVDLLEATAIGLNERLAEREGEIL